MNQRQLGSLYEERATEYLKTKGYRILERNFRNRMGEIDIIAKDGAYFCFIEVKYRTSNRYGSPLEAVGYRNGDDGRLSPRVRIYRQGTQGGQERYHL